MKVVQIETLIDAGSISNTTSWKRAHRDILAGIASIHWPSGSGKFTIRPESGKKTGEGNGVKPIKVDFIRSLEKAGWEAEAELDLATRVKPGPLDAALTIDEAVIAAEWETGNISSSHRAMNKMALGVIKGKITAGVLVVPSRALYPYLTDRIGNWDELEPYFDLWRGITCKRGLLQVISVEHDATSTTVARIPKGTDGRASV
jgi:hypothetical protein